MLLIWLMVKLGAYIGCVVLKITHNGFGLCVRAGLLTTKVNLKDER